MNSHSFALPFLRSQSTLQVPGTVVVLLESDDHQWRVGEEVVHLLEGQFRRLWEEQPEKQCVGEITDDEQEVISIPDIGHCDRGHLADHGVERKRSHGGDGHPLGASPRVKDFGRNDP